MGFGHFIQADKKRHTRNIILFVTETQLYIIKKIRDLLNKRAIESVPERLRIFQHFLLSSKEGRRFSSNFEHANSECSPNCSRFQDWHVQPTQDAMRKGDWVIFLDLKGAFFHVPFCQQHRQYLRFCFQGKHYQFRVMLFGFAAAQRVFI